VDETNVYWTNKGRLSLSGPWDDDAVGTVMKLPLSGGTPTTLASGQYWPDSVVVDRKNAYWTTHWVEPPWGADGMMTDKASVMRVALDGGKPIMLFSGTTPPGQIAVDATSVYWAYPGDRGNDFVDGAIVKLSVAGDDLTWITLPGQTRPWGVALDATNVYWTTLATSSGHYMNGSVMKVPLGGGTITTLASDQAEPSSVFVDSTTVYWTNSCNPSPGWSCGVMGAPLGGGSATTLASGQTGPFAITADATSLYWVNYSDGSNNGGGAVMKMPLGGGTPTTLAKGLFRPNGMAVDATSVYWITESWTGSDGTVMKLTPK
jgi:sugar lactone lactonase YvrE